MKPTTTFTIQKKTFFDAINAASKTSLTQGQCERLYLNPVLSAIVFSLNDYYTLSVMAAGKHRCVSTSVPLIERKGDTRDFAIMELDIYPILRRLDDQEIKVELYEHQAVFHHSYGTFTVPLVTEGLDVFFSVFHSLEQRLCTHKVEIEAPFFHSMTRRLCRYTAQDDLRPVLAGIHIRQKAGKLDFVATDGHRLMRITKEDQECSLESSLTIQLDIIKILRSITPRTGLITLYYSEYNEKEADSFVCHAIIDNGADFWFIPTERKYPNYDTVTPKKSTWTLNIQRTLFKQSLDRISLFTDLHDIIRMDTRKDSITLFGKDKDFSLQATETLPCQYQGTPMKIGIRIKNMDEILSSMKSRSVVMQGHKPFDPVIITPGEQSKDEEVTILFMPCAISDDEEE